MKNYRSPGRNIAIVFPSAAQAGDPVVIGDLAGVASGDVAAGEEGVLVVEGVFDLAVTGEDGSGNTTVAAGEKVYLDGATLNKDTGGKPFGKVLAAVESGTTKTVPVKVIQA